MLEGCTDLFKPKECENFFATCGYDTTCADSALATEGSAVCRKSSQSAVASAIVVPPSKASEFALEEEERVNMGHFFSLRIDNSEDEEVAFASRLSIQTYSPPNLRRPRHRKSGFLLWGWLVESRFHLIFFDALCRITALSEVLLFRAVAHHS
jgi:hypothetical protein